MIVRDILRSLKEAKKTYKNSMSSKDKTRLAQSISAAASNDSWVSKAIVKLRIQNADDFIDHVESGLRKHNYQVLIKYVPWLVKTFTYDIINSDLGIVLTNIDAVADIVLKYDKLKRKGHIQGNTDYLLSFYEMVEIVARHEFRLRSEADYYSSGEAELLYRKDGVRFIKIHTFEAGKFFGRGKRERSTPWCIIDTEQHFDSYKTAGAKWIFILDKKEGEKYAVDDETGAVWDKNNRNQSISFIIRTYPAIEKFLDQHMLTVRGIRNE